MVQTHDPGAFPGPSLKLLNMKRDGALRFLGKCCALLRSPQVLRNSFLVHLALASMVVAQPIFSVTRDLSFFVAWRLSSVEYTICILLIYLVPPSVTYLFAKGAGWIHPRLGQTSTFLIHCAYFAVGSWMVLQKILTATGVTDFGLIVSCGIVLLVSLLLTSCVSASPALQSYMRLVGIVTVVFPVLMLVQGVKGGLIELQSAQPVTVNIENPEKQNVIFIIYDELPLSTILNEAGLIDSEKFPSFSAFARTATWFPNVRTLAGNTTLALPQILAGVLPRRPVPATFKSYPSNIFHLLSGHFNIIDLQFATDLNPVKLPGDEAASYDSNKNYPARFSRILDDISIIYAHIAVPAELTQSLPRIDTQPNRFGEDVLNSARGQRHHEKFLTSLAQVDSPFLAVYHNVYPHNMWAAMPSGTAYPLPRWGDYVSLNRGSEFLDADETKILHDYQAHLFQSMHADKLFGELISRLKENDQFDNSLIVFVADHGVSLWPRQHPRGATEFSWLDIHAVPLMVKLPGQTEAKISMDWVLTADIYPTVLDYFNAKTPDSIDGKSLLDLIRRSQAASSVASTSYRDDPAVVRKAKLFGSGTGRNDLFGFGRYRSYIGQSVANFQIERSADLFADLLRPIGTLRVEGRIAKAASWPDKWNILVAINDEICGGTGTSDYEKTGKADAFTLLIAEECLKSTGNTIRLFTTTSDPARLLELNIVGVNWFYRIEEVIVALRSFSDSLFNHYQKLPNGAVGLSTLRGLGVEVSSIFVRGGELSWPWGQAVVMKNDSELTLDLYSPSYEICSAVVSQAGKTFSRIKRVATTSQAVDEVTVPLTLEDANSHCSRKDRIMIRIIMSSQH